MYNQCEKSLMSIYDEDDNCIGFFEEKQFKIGKQHNAYSEVKYLYNIFDLDGRYIQSSTDYSIAFSILKYYTFFIKNPSKTENSKDLWNKVICSRCGEQHELFTVLEIIQPFLCERCRYLSQTP